MTISQSLADDNGLRALHPAVTVDGQVHLVTNGSPDGFDASNAGTPGSLGACADVVASAQLVEGGQFDGGESLVHCLVCCAGEAFGSAISDVTVDIGVETQAVTDGSPEKGVDRNAEVLSHDIPECLLNTAEGSVGHTATIEAGECVPD